MLPSSVASLFTRIIGRPPSGGEAPIVMDLVVDDDEIVAAQIAESRLALAEPATTIRLYEAAFGTKPDAEGYVYWIQALQGETPLSIKEMARAFAQSETFLTRFSLHAGRDELIEQLYLNVLGREADDQGFTFWQRSTYSDYEMLAYFSESAEFKSRTSDGIRDFFLDIALEGPLDPTGTDNDDYRGSVIELQIELPPVVF